MDAPAVRAFERRGLGKYLGVRCVEDRDDSIMERFVDNDPINEGFEGFVLDVRPAFYGGVGTIMETTDPKTRVISELVDPEGAYQGVATSLYENELGGRVCVMGYGAFRGMIRPEFKKIYAKYGETLEELGIKEKIHKELQELLS